MWRKQIASVAIGGLVAELSRALLTEMLQSDLRSVTPAGTFVVIMNRL